MHPMLLDFSKCNGAADGVQFQKASSKSLNYIQLN